MILFFSVDLLFPKNKLKNTAVNTARLYLHRELVVGKITVGLLSGVKVESLNLSKLQGFSYGDFLSLKDIQVRVDLLELLKNKAIKSSVSIDSIDIDLVKKENIFLYLIKSLQAGHSDKKYILYNTFQTFPAASVRFKFGKGSLHYTCKNGSMILKFNGIADVSLDSNSQTISFKDILITQDGKTLSLSGFIKDLYTPERFSYSIDIKGDREILEKLLKLSFNYDPMNDTGFQIGNSSAIDLSITGNLQNFKAVSNINKNSVKPQSLFDLPKA